MPTRLKTQHLVSVFTLVCVCFQDAKVFGFHTANFPWIFHRKGTLPSRKYPPLSIHPFPWPRRKARFNSRVAGLNRESELCSEEWSPNANLLARKIRQCGTNITLALDYISRIPNINPDSKPFELAFEDCYLAALEVCGGYAGGRRNKDYKQQINDEERIKIALSIFEKCPTEACRARTISICGQVGHYRKAIETLRTVPNKRENETSILKTNLDSASPVNSWDTCEESNIPSIQSFNAALAACARAAKWRQANSILIDEVMPLAKEGKLPPISTLSCNIILSAMRNAKAGEAAIQFLRNMIDDNIKGEKTDYPIPDRASFHHTMNAVIAAENSQTNVDQAYNLLTDMLHFDVDVRPNNATFDLLTRAYGRLGDWSTVRFIDTELRYYHQMPLQEKKNVFPDPGSIRSTPVDSKYSTEDGHMGFRRWNCSALRKCGTGKSAYWSFASYIDPSFGTNLTVALQPHRNPSKNGMKILLYENSFSSEAKKNFEWRKMKHEPPSHLLSKSEGVQRAFGDGKQKTGFLLMNNALARKSGTDADYNTSTLLGLYLNPAVRKKKLSKVFIAIWLDLCLQAKVIPEIGVMNKPLLALVLQDTFGFYPSTNTTSAVFGTSSVSGGVDIEIARGHDGKIEIYSFSSKHLQGAFATWDLEREGIRLIRDPPNPRGRVCRVGTTLAVDYSDTQKTILREAVSRQLKGEAGTGSLLYFSDDLRWRSILLGI